MGRPGAALGHACWFPDKVVGSRAEEEPLGQEEAEEPRIAGILSPQAGGGHVLGPESCPPRGAHHRLPLPLSGLTERSA